MLPRKNPTDIYGLCSMKRIGTSRCRLLRARARKKLELAQQQLLKKVFGQREAVNQLRNPKKRAMMASTAIEQLRAAGVSECLVGHGDVYGLQRLFLASLDNNRSDRRRRRARTRIARAKPRKAVANPTNSTALSRPNGRSTNSN